MMRAVNRNLGWAAVAGVLLATAAAYAPSIDGEFQYDDQEIAKTTWVRDAARFLSPSPWREVARPLTGLTFAVNHAMDGFRPRVWHVTNVLVHLAVVLLAWRFARRILARARLEAPEWAALAAAAVFALHPLHTQAVSYISQRSEALATALYLATLLVLLTWDRAAPGRRWTLLAGAAALHALGLLAKPVAATAPFAWLLAAAVLPPPAEDGARWYGRVGRRLPAAAPLVALSLLAAAQTMTSVKGSGHAGFDLATASPPDYLATQLRAIPTYLRLVAWPSGLNADWDFPFSRSFLEPAVLAAAALLAAFVAGAILLARRFAGRQGDGAAAARAAAFGGLFFLGVLAPTLIVPLRDPVVEHRLYLATLGIVLAATAAAAALVRRLAPGRAGVAGAIVAALVLAGLGAATAARNRVWQSGLALWSDAARKAPGKPRIWVNLGTALHFAGRYEEAVRAFDRALALPVDGTVPLETVVRNTAVALVRLGRLDEARGRLVGYLAAAPRDAGTIVVLALIDAETGRFDDAERRAREALAIDPRLSRPVHVLGQVQESRGDLDGAFDWYAHASRLDLADPLPYYSMGRIHERLGRVAEACGSYVRAQDALQGRSTVARLAADAHRRLCAGSPPPR
jgi:tetratricopeptide (TPR) repeat protein